MSSKIVEPPVAADISPAAISERAKNAMDQRNLIVIEPAAGISVPFREIWRHRELLYFLFWRDVKVRYKQTVLGASWALLQPLTTMIVFSLVLGRLAKVSSDGIPYSIFALSGLLPWQLFAFALAESSASLVSNQHLISKVYFPRVIIPISAILVGLVDFAIASGLLGVLMIYYHVRPTYGLLILPLLVVYAAVAALSIGITLSAINLKYRDVRHTVPFLVQIWMFATPIVYPTSLVPAKWRLLYSLNPMTGVVDGFRWALFGTRTTSGSLIIISIASVLLLFVFAITYFHRMERQFADLV